MIIRKAMYGCGLYFFIKLAYNSPILCKFAFLIAQNCELNARRNLLLEILEFCARKRISLTHNKLRKYRKKCAIIA